MITKKEDLIDCYVNGKNEELAKLFQEKLFSFGIKWLHFKDQEVRIPDDEYEYICFDGEFISWNRELYTKEHYKTELTLSDFKPSKEESAVNTLEMLGYVYHGAELWEPPVKKPRTRTEYEKVTESIFDLREGFERGELFMKLGDELITVPNETQLSILLDHKQCYRKVEKEIDWRDEVESFLCSCPEVRSFVLTKYDIAISGRLSHDTYLELCRVALRANGEL